MWACEEHSEQNLCMGSNQRQKLSQTWKTMFRKYLFIHLDVNMCGNKTAGALLVSKLATVLRNATPSTWVSYICLWTSFSRFTKLTFELTRNKLLLWVKSLHIRYFGNEKSSRWQKELQYNLFQLANTDKAKRWAALFMLQQIISTYIVYL